MRNVIPKLMPFLLFVENNIMIPIIKDIYDAELVPAISMNALIVNNNFISLKLSILLRIPPHINNRAIIAVIV